MRKYKKYIFGLCRYLKTQFFCGEYGMTIGFLEEDREEKDSWVCASINTDDKYLTFRIKVYPPLYEAWKDKDYEKIAECLTHEFAHLLTDPLYKIAINAVANSSVDFLEDIRERQTQRITNIIFPKIPKAIYTPKTIKKRNMKKSMSTFGKPTKAPKVQDRALRVKTTASKASSKTTALRKLRKTS